jgi:hypothetical protein
MTGLGEDDATNHFSAKTLSAGCFGSNRSGIMEADPLTRV